MTTHYSTSYNTQSSLQKYALLKNTTKSKQMSTYTLCVLEHLHYMLLRLSVLTLYHLIIIRYIQWNELQASRSDSMMLIGKGTFAKCYHMKLVVMKVCIKILNLGEKYKALFCAEAGIIALLCHCDLLWLHAIRDDSESAYMMHYQRMWKYMCGWQPFRVYLRSCLSSFKRYPPY